MKKGKQGDYIKELAEAFLKGSAEEFKERLLSLVLWTPHMGVMWASGPLTHPANHPARTSAPVPVHLLGPSVFARLFPEAHSCGAPNSEKDRRNKGKITQYGATVYHRCPKTVIL